MEPTKIIGRQLWKSHEYLFTGNRSGHSSSNCSIVFLNTGWITADAISVSGIKTNLLFCISGCGTVTNGSLIVCPLTNKISISMILGPYFSCLGIKWCVNFQCLVEERGLIGLAPSSSFIDGWCLNNRPTFRFYILPGRCKVGAPITDVCARQ